MKELMKTGTLVALVALSSMLGLSACQHNDSALENTGEEIDEAAHDAGRAIEDATD